MVLLICGLAAVKVNAIRGIGEDVRSRQCASVTRLIIVLHGSITSQAQKAPDLFAFKVEIFQVTCLFVLNNCFHFSTIHLVWTLHQRRSLSDGPDSLFSNCLFMQINDLLVNITMHVLRPKHRILSEGEKQVLLQRYSIEAKQVSS